MERNRKVQVRLPGPRPPWNLPVSLHVSLERNYERFNADFPN
jgi:hypothetical protein